MWPMGLRDDIAMYHAALLDTEGSIVFEGSGSVHYSVEQIGYDYLAGICRQAGVGQIARQGGDRAHITRFSIRAHAEVFAYISALWAYAYKKRGEIEVALQLLDGTITASTARERIDAIRAAYRD